MRRPDTRRGGFTLAEVVVAISIMGLCLGGLCALAVTTREVADRARRHWVASNIGKNRLELARSCDLKEIATLAESQVLVGETGLADASGDYRRTTAVTPLSVELVQMTVTTEIRNRVTRAFDGEGEVVTTDIADFRRAGL